MGVHYLERAHRRGLRCAIADYGRNLSAKEVKLGLLPGDEVYSVPGKGDEAWYSAASAALADGRIDGVLGLSEPHVVPAALIAGELGLPSPGLLAGMVSRNKLFQRQIFRRNDIPQPAFQLCDSIDEAVSWASTRYPVVLKPLVKSGAKGVRVVFDDADATAWATEPDAPARFLAEEYIAANEFSCEAAVRRGRIVFINVTEKIITKVPYCVELGHYAPAGCDAAERERIENLARRVVDLTKMSDGLLHLEVKSGDRGLHALEFAVRTPGDFIMELISLALGVDLYEAALDIALGQQADVTASSQRAACVWFPEIPAGTVESVTGLRELPGLPAFVSSSVELAPGTRITRVRCSDDRVGGVIMCASDRAALDRDAASARQLLRVTVASTGGAGDLSAGHRRR